MKINTELQRALVVVVAVDVSCRARIFLFIGGGGQLGQDWHIRCTDAVRKTPGMGRSRPGRSQRNSTESTPFHPLLFTKFLPALANDQAVQVRESFIEGI